MIIKSLIKSGVFVSDDGRNFCRISIICWISEDFAAICGVSSLRSLLKISFDVWLIFFFSKLRSMSFERSCSEFVFGYDFKAAKISKSFHSFGRFSISFRNNIFCILSSVLMFSSFDNIYTPMLFVVWITEGVFSTDVFPTTSFVFVLFTILLFVGFIFGFIFMAVSFCSVLF